MSRPSEPSARRLLDWAPENGARPAEDLKAPPSGQKDVQAESAAGERIESVRLTRRSVLKVLASAAAAAPAVGCGPSGREAGSSGGDVDPGPLPAANPLAAGTAADPDLIAPTVPWPMKLTEPEMITVRSLADLIIPADERSPSASQVGAHLFVNEHVSAPYPSHERDLILVRGGLVWLNTESGRRFGSAFHELSLEQQRALCDDICYQPDAAPEHRAAARFFDKIRDLVSTAFWTTDEGMRDLGYLGNVAMAGFAGPPPEVLRRLGLEEEGA